MELEVAGFALNVLGEILIAYGILSVHGRLIEERSIDQKAINEMKRERGIVISGIVLIVIGALMQLPSKL